MFWLGKGIKMIKKLMITFKFDEGPLAEEETRKVSPFAAFSFSMDKVNGDALCASGVDFIEIKPHEVVLVDRKGKISEEKK